MNLEEMLQAIKEKMQKERASAVNGVEIWYRGMVKGDMLSERIDEIRQERLDEADNGPVEFEIKIKKMDIEVYGHSRVKDEEHGYLLNLTSLDDKEKIVLQVPRDQTGSLMEGKARRAGMGKTFKLKVCYRGKNSVPIIDYQFSRIIST